MKQYTSNNNSTKGHVYSNKRNDYSYETEENKLLSFFIWVFTIVIVLSILGFVSTITVKAGGIWDTAKHTVPTSLCHDPLLGPSMIIYSDCSTSTEEPKNKGNDTLHGVIEVVPVVSVIIPDNDDIPVQDDNTPTDDTGNDSKQGNPGNDKPVGNAGEKCDKGMCENSDGITGEHGKSKND